MPDEKITTSGDLRSILADAILRVRDGSLSTDKADRIAKLAAQISSSLLAETQIAEAKLHKGGVGLLRIDGGRDVPVIEAKSEPIKISAQIVSGGKIFCEQCDRNVPAPEAARCKSPFCKAKEAA